MIRAKKSDGASPGIAPDLPAPPGGGYFVAEGSGPEAGFRPEPGLRARILSPATDGDGVGARVAVVDGDRLVLRISSAPSPEREAALAAGEVQLLLGRRDAAYLFAASVVSRPGDGTVEVLLRGHPLRLQRREYFRLAVRLPMAVRMRAPSGAVQAEQDAESPAHAPEIRIFRLADLSGGGCLCFDPDHLLRRGRLYQASLDLHDGEPPLPVRTEVVRRGVSLGCPSVGMRFVAFAEKHRERVMRTLFQEYRRQLNRGRG